LTSPRKATKRRKALMKLDEDISLMTINVIDYENEAYC
jgi:hypothetical protein